MDSKVFCCSVPVVSISCQRISYELDLNGLNRVILFSYIGLQRQKIGQMVKVDISLGAEYKGMFYYVFKFPDISRELIGHQNLEYSRIHTLDKLFLKHIQFVDEPFHKKGNILHPLP